MKNTTHLIGFLGLLFLSSCLKQSTTQSPNTPAKPLTSFVNTFIGTGGHGHTYPGASLPFGMMQLSPDTRLTGWDGCSGYHYSDSYIYGFSHTHLSGTGVSDYGDILLMPTTEAILNNGADGKPGYRTRFDHQNESAEPGFYSVLLDSTNIKVELAVSKRSGIHQYQFPEAKNQYIILDLAHRDEVLGHEINFVSATEIAGKRISKAWADEQHLYYYMKLSHPIIAEDLVWSDDKKKVAIHVENQKNDPVSIKVGISAIDINGAQKNMETEIGSKDFRQIKTEASVEWEKQLKKIEVVSSNETNKINFYTSMYHSMLAPNLYTDVDGRYRGLDLKIHTTEEFDYYTVFSLWDTYRALHPLYTIIEQERTNDFVNTFISKYDEGGIIPIWDLAGCYTHCMIGYHAVPVIADAYLKGIQGYDTEKAFEAMKHSAAQNKLGLESYKNLGYIPVEEESESVSKTLEYAYDDWTIALMAKSMNKDQDYKTYLERAQYYKNIYDPSSKFMRGRFRNTWFSPFDPYEVNFNYTEANAWQYSFYVPQDVSGFIDIMGGKSSLEQQLDDLFVANNETAGRDQKDITGLIGQYAHGNEPSHHIAYLYNFINKPHKTQEKVNEILTTLYTNQPDGISGNEDCGQMSAWYILSSLGFYPVSPGNNEYVIGSPLFDEATINLENGNRFEIICENNSDQNIYVQSVELNGQPYPYSYLNHMDIVKGGKLVFEMGPSPSDWGTQDEHIPKTQIDEHVITPVPYIAQGEIAFTESTTVQLDCLDKEAEIYYQVDLNEEMKYVSPITLSDPSTLKVYAVNNGTKSAEIRTQFYKINPDVSIQLSTEFANQYNAGGNNALIDGILGASDFRTGTWQGYWDTNVDATLNLSKPTIIKKVETNFLIDQRSWIFSPKKVECLGSKDGVNFETIDTYVFEEAVPDESVRIETVTFEVNSSNYQYIKLVATNYGDLPEWHLGHAHDGKSWTFIDEISVK